MIEQINISFGAKKGPGIFSLGHWSSASETNVRKESIYTSIKSDEEWTSRVLPSEQDDIVNYLITRGIAVIERAHLLSWQWQTALALSQTK